ncbi:MAG: C4-dicarboxylate transporter DctQ subunit [Paracoccaceae bacterium]|jgi:C4-dicarboxylate transporter DctQ subunit
MTPLISKSFARLDRAMSLLEVTVVTVLLVVSVTIVVVDILSRILLGVSISWASELARYAIVWMVFVGGSIGARNGAHISIDILGETLPPHIARLVLLISSLTASVSCAVISFLGYQLMSRMMMFTQKSPSLEIPMWMVYAVIPAAFALMSIRFAQAGIAAEMSERRLNLATSTG